MTTEKRPEIITQFLNSFSDQEKNDLIDLEDEAREVSVLRSKLLKKNLTGNNEVEQDVSGE